MRHGLQYYSNFLKETLQKNRSSSDTETEITMHCRFPNKTSILDDCTQFMGHAWIEILTWKLWSWRILQTPCSPRSSKVILVAQITVAPASGTA